jgi:hypothetical protein
MNDMEREILIQIIEANAEKIKASAAFNKLSKEQMLELKRKFILATQTK